MSDKPLLVLDVGGTKLAAGIMLADNQIHYRAETLTMAQEGAHAVLARLFALGQQVVERAQVAGITPAAVGLASAGYIDHATGAVLFATDNLPGWTGQQLGEQLESAFGLPVFVENDAACFALAEAALGAGRGYPHVLVVAVGTGTGGGLIINGQLYTGWQGRAGAIGHHCVEPVNGRPCSCGLYGCWESYTATRIMVERSGFPSIQALAAHYQAGGDAPAADEAARWLGIGLASLVHVVGPQAIVIGGSVGLLGPRYLQTASQAYRVHAMPHYHAIPLLPGQLAADTGLLGAGSLARRALGQL